MSGDLMVGAVLRDFIIPRIGTVSMPKREIKKIGRKLIVVNKFDVRGMINGSYEDQNIFRQ
jgi:hypothetical protein